MEINDFQKIKNLVPSLLSDYRLVEKIGEGEFGYVFKVEKDGNFFALKIRKPNTFFAPSIKEILTMKNLSCIKEWFEIPCAKYIKHAFELEQQQEDCNEFPSWEWGLIANITQTSVDVVKKSKVKVGVVMEYLDGFKPVNFHENIQKNKPELVQLIIEAIKSINSAGYYHGDIKGENILYNKSTNKVILVDFGCSEKIQIQNQNYSDLECLEDAIKFWFM